jgi:hypothetical protein
MKLILFIGHHKVGTTSLQTFLACNRRNLLRSGILYPGIELRTRGYFLENLKGLQGAFVRAPTPERLTINAREPHNALALKMLREYRGKTSPPPIHRNVPSASRMQAIIREQIDRFDPEVTILCAEAFSNFSGGAQSLARELKAAFPADDVHIVCVLRRIDQYVVSWFGQLLKFGNRLQPLRGEGLDKLLNTIHVDYRKVLRSWRKAYPEAKFSVRNYTDVLNNGGIIEDFFEVCELEPPVGLETGVRTNPSIPKACYELCRQANLTLEDQFSREIRAAIIRDAESGGLCTARDVELLGRVNRERLFERFKPVHDYLKRFTGVTEFFPDQGKVLQLCSENEYAAASEAKVAILDRARSGQLKLSEQSFEFVEKFTPESGDLFSPAISS